MDKETLDKLRGKLEADLAELKQSLEAGVEATEPVKLDTSIGRLSRMDAIQSQQMALGLKARQQQTMQRIERALRSIHEGTYGQCRRCRGDIGIERLEAQPDAVICVRCATQAER